MNLFEKKKELLELIHEYLNGKCNIDFLREFAWDIIDYFSKTKKEQLPPFEEFEKEFWFVIWQIQHVADEEHEKEGITKKTLEEALDYLQNKKKLPEEYIGTRP